MRWRWPRALPRRRLPAAGIRLRVPRTGTTPAGSPTTEPDVAVVRGAIRDYMEAHPTSAVLVVEVSNESLRYDRTVKQHLYARCRIPEYWILALPEARLEVYRDPAGDGYQSVTNRAAGDKVAALARPDAEIAVDDLLP